MSLKLGSSSSYSCYVGEPNNNLDSQDKRCSVDSVSASAPSNQRIIKLPPECFVCAENGKKHYLADCVTFKE